MDSIKSTETAIKEYIRGLKSLKGPDKNTIHFLTDLARETLDNPYKNEIGKGIAQELEKKLLDATTATQQLAYYYLIDSLLKHVREVSYAEYFKDQLAPIFCNIFRLADTKMRTKLHRLRTSWNGFLPAETLHRLDVSVRRIDPAWPVFEPNTALKSSNEIARTSAGSGASVPHIHVNPRFLNPGNACSSRSIPVPPPPPPPLLVANTSTAVLDAAALAERERLLRLKEEELNRLKEELLIQRAKKSNEISQSSGEEPDSTTSSMPAVTIAGGSVQTASSLVVPEKSESFVLDRHGDDTVERKALRAGIREIRATPITLPIDSVNPLGDVDMRRESAMVRRRIPVGAGGKRFSREEAQQHVQAQQTAIHQLIDDRRSRTLTDMERCELVGIMGQLQSIGGSAMDGIIRGVADLLEKPSPLSNALPLAARRRPAPTDSSDTTPFKRPRSGSEESSPIPDNFTRALDSFLSDTMAAPASQLPLTVPSGAATSVLPLATPAARIAHLNKGKNLIGPPDRWRTPIRTFDMPDIGVDPRLLNLAEVMERKVSSTCEIKIDGKTEVLCLRRIQPLLIKPDGYHAVRFRTPEGFLWLLVDNLRFKIGCNGVTRIFDYSQRSHVVCLGGPRRELIVDGRFFNVTVNGPSVELDLLSLGQIANVRLTVPHNSNTCPPPPQLDICPAVPEYILKYADEQLFGSVNYVWKPPYNPLDEMRKRRIDVRTMPMPPDRLSKIEKAGGSRKAGFENESSSQVQTQPSLNEGAIASTQDTKSTVDVSQLFQRLVATGLLVQTTVEPEKEPDLRSFNSELINKPNRFVTKRIYEGYQCPQCGIRFLEGQNSSQYDSHLDYHFMTRALERSNPVRSRGWSAHWTIFLKGDIEFEDSAARSAFPEEEPSQTLVKPRVPSHEDSSKNQCSVCFEPFESSWDDDQEAWMWEDCVLIGSKYYHSICSEDAENEPVDMTEDPLSALSKVLSGQMEKINAHKLMTASVVTTDFETSELVLNLAEIKDFQNSLGGMMLKTEPMEENETENKDSEEQCERAATPTKDEPIDVVQFPATSDIQNHGAMASLRETNAVFDLMTLARSAVLDDQKDPPTPTVDEVLDPPTPTLDETETL